MESAVPRQRGAPAMVIAGLALYFAIPLLRHRVPAVGLGDFYFWYVVSVPVVLLVLIVIGVAGAIQYFRSAREVRRRGKGLLLVSAAGALLFAAALVGDSFVDRSLPTGSFAWRFDRSAWNAPRSAEFVRGDITPRQKMLGDVVRHILPGRTRSEIEHLLGPSRNTPYFLETGRDLIYILGPERDSFGVDSEWLLIYVDPRGTFARYELRVD